MSATPKPAPPMAPLSSFCTAGPTIFTASSMSRRLLASAGYRVIVPYVRGYGTTRFLSSDTVRNGQPSAVAVDMIALMDALKIEKAILAGFDWGARTANIVAALWPERCKAMVSVSGYLIGSQEAGKMPLPPKAELQWWYQFYFATDRGRAGYDKYRHDFAKLIWQIASPKWNFDDATFDRSAAAFDNPDHVAIVVHNYRWRLGLAEGEAKYDDLEKRLAAAPVITVPDHHHGRRRQRRAASGAQRLRQEILRQICAPANQGRHRSQSASGSSARFCPSRHRHCQDLTMTNSARIAIALKGEWRDGLSLSNSATRCSIHIGRPIMTRERTKFAAAHAATCRFRAKVGGALTLAFVLLSAAVVLPSSRTRPSPPTT